MKTVFTNQGVAQKWAENEQAEGYSGTGALYFVGQTIYSYGRHFPIATIVGTREGKVVLFTINRYSVTTSNHCSEARGAVHRVLDCPVFNVPAVSELFGKAPHVSNYDSYFDRINAARLSAKRARKEWSIQGHHRDARDLVEEANAYARLFINKGRIPYTPEEEALPNYS